MITFNRLEIIQIDQNLEKAEIRESTKSF